MPKTRPIDRSKRVNRRCVNCAMYSSCTPLPFTMRQSKSLHCPTADKDVDYWNCCKKFSWNPEKTYVN